MAGIALPIRYSPSGPIIENGDGGQAVPGEGFTLRIVDALATAGSLTFSGTMQAIPKSGPETFALGLANPKAGLRYHAECLVPVANTDSASAVVELGSQWRVDGGAWGQLAPAQRFELKNVTASGQSNLMLFRSLLTLGSALPSPVLVSSVLLEVQFTARVAPGAAVLGVGDLVGRLVETL